MKNFSKTKLVKLTNAQSKQQGAVLLEALIAILIFSFGILAIAGLQGAMVKNTTDSNYRAEASYIVQQQVGRMWANPANLTAFATTTIDVSDRLPAGQLVVTKTLGNRMNFRVTWQTPGEDAHNFETNASIDANL